MVLFCKIFVFRYWPAHDLILVETCDRVFRSAIGANKSLRRRS